MMSQLGEMAERSKAHAWKACEGFRPPGVRIPLSPLVENTADEAVIFLSGERAKCGTLCVGIRKPCLVFCETAVETKY